MLSEDRLLAFAEALSARADATAAAEVSTSSSLPPDMARLLAKVGGRSFDDVRFATPEESGAEGEARSDDVRWNPAWCLVATTETEIFAYDPLGCFRGRPGQVVAMSAGERGWHVFPTLDFWLGALERGASERSDARASAAARSWAEARGRLYFVTAPEGAGAVFDLPLGVLSYLGVARKELVFDGFVAYTLSRGRDAGPALVEIARALDASVPFSQLRHLEAVGVEPVDARVPWFDALVAKHAKKAGVTRLLFGRTSRGGELAIWAWPAAAGEEPGLTQRNMSATRAFERLTQVAEEAMLGHSVELSRFSTALLTFLVRDLLEACAARLPFPGELDVLVEGRLVGRVDRDGFVPAPLSVVDVLDRTKRESANGALRSAGFPGMPPALIEYPLPEDVSSPTRTLRHPDGRSVEARIEEGRWSCTTVDADGERDTFSRPTEAGWEPETFIAMQRRSGFVEA